MVWFGMVWYGGGCQMTGEFIHEEISMLFHSEKFYGWVAQAVIHLVQAVM